ncbi:MAG: MATE family efflux transporter [Clostridia bacterium]|nr:MATE family efflux transporter [Clostridia bacterium]
MATASENRMTEGSIAGKITRFAIPLFLGNLFQQLYNTADTLIVGRLLGDSALAAVSSSGSLLFLLVGFFGGLSMGAGVVISQFFGAKDDLHLRRAVHTNLMLSVLVGIFLTVFGVLMAPQILIWMDTPENVLGPASEYVRVYFAGVISMVMYNACMGIMQAVGDSRHPLYYLIISSCSNIVLDIVFIRFFRMSVGGAAFATVLSQMFSVILCLIRLFRADTACKIRVRELKIDREMLIKIIRYGLPSAMQNSVIALANVVVQSNINYFGEAAMAGCGAYAKIEGFSFLPVTCFTAAITTFVGQNLGAGLRDRVKKGAASGVITAMLLAELIGLVIFIAAPVLISAFATGAEAIAFGIQKSRVSALFFLLCAASHCLSAVLRGAGRANVPMLITLASWCVIRVTILKIFVPITQTIDIVNWVYPITWSISTLALIIYILRVDWLTIADKKPAAEE